MRIRSRPKKPVRKKGIRRETSTYDEVSVGALMEEYGPDATLEIESGWNSYDYPYIKVVWTEEESEEAFARRMKRYEDDLERYNKWYEENKEEIEAELARREILKKEKAKKVKLREIEARKKEIARLEKKLKKLKKQGV